MSTDSVEVPTQDLTGGQTAASKTGLSPGTMVFIGERKQAEARVDVMDYTADSLTELSEASVAQARQWATGPGVTWIHFSGLHAVQQIADLGTALGLHSLTLEDIVNTSQRLKVEDFGDYLFIVLKIMWFDETTRTVELDHLSLVLGDRFVISFQERDTAVFDAVRKRVRTGKRIRLLESDYLAYVLMDAVVDHYFLGMERLAEHIEQLDEAILAGVEPDNIGEIHRLKREVLTLRRTVWPLREGVRVLEKSESDLIRPSSRLFWRDLYDHSAQLMDMTENARDQLASMHDTYLSSLSHRMNEVMKMLTMIATIFIPLTFIAGIYGMNFDHMPELGWRYGYFAVLAGMAAAGGALVVYFRRLKWL